MWLESSSHVRKAAFQEALGRPIDIGSLLQCSLESIRRLLGTCTAGLSAKARRQAPHSCGGQYKCGSLGCNPACNRPRLPPPHVPGDGLCLCPQFCSPLIGSSILTASMAEGSTRGSDVCRHVTCSCDADSHAHTPSTDSWTAKAFALLLCLPALSRGGNGELGP